MNESELNLFQRMNQMVKELRNGYGRMMSEGNPPAGMVSRDAVATRLVVELADWAESQEEGGGDE